MSHFYEKRGGCIVTRHTVLNAAQTKQQGRDVFRDTRITDVRGWLKEGLEVVPSVTTIMSMLDKGGGLTHWQVQQHLEVAHALTAYPARDKDRFIKEVRRLASEEMKKPAAAGSEFHYAFELFSKGELKPGHKYEETCEAIKQLIKDKTGDGDVLAEVDFVRDGYGGQIDIIASGYSAFIIDLKTKLLASKFKSPASRMVYPDHVRQLAAYINGYNDSGVTQAANIFVCLETGEIAWVEHEKKDLDKQLIVFLKTLDLWQEINL